MAVTEYAPSVTALRVQRAVHYAAGLVGGKLSSTVDRLGDSMPAFTPSRQTLGRVVGVVLSALSTGMAVESGNAEATPNKARASQALSPATFNVFTNTNPDAVLQAASQQQSPAELNAIGGALVNTIPGHSVDFKQPTLSIEGIPSQTARATFACPSSSSSLAPTSLQSVEILPENRAQVTPCPSRMIVTESTVNPNDPALAGAIAKFRSDPYRSGEDWAGNDWRLNVFFDCPDRVTTQDPHINLKYNPQKGVAKVSFYGAGMGQYCDIVGRYSERVYVLVKKNGGKFKKMGTVALHNDGLPEILGSMYSIPLRYKRSSVEIPNVGKLCTGNKKNRIQARALVVYQFKGKQSQRFQSQAGRSIGIRSTSKAYKNPVQTIC